MSSGEESFDDEVKNDLEIIEEGGEPIQEGEEEPENIIDQVEVNNEDTNARSRIADIQEETATEDKKVKPKRIVRNPQPKLNEQTLQGPKGLSTIHSYFERVKFKGRGYEEHDLNILMKNYEHWCHRLFPKFPFDDCIERLEKLGTKRGTQTEVKRIRMGLEFLDPEKPVISDEEENHEEENNEEENHSAGFVDTYNDQFDQLLPSTSNQSQPEITEDQMERIRQNKERAQRLREERLRKIKEKAQNSLGQSSGIITQASQLSTKDSHSDNLTSNNSHTDNENHLGNEEDNIENIVDFINAEDKSRSKNQNVLESDSEDEIIGKTSKDTVRNVNVRRHIIESDEDEEVNVQNDITESNEDEDIENILAEINSDDNSVVIPNDTTRRAVNAEKNDSSINFQIKIQNVQSDNDKENGTNNILGEMHIDNNEQNMKSDKSKLSVIHKAEEFSTSQKISEEAVQVSETPLDNNSRLTIQNGNSDTNSINEEQMEEDDMENMEEDDMENILIEINSDAHICELDSEMNIDDIGNKTLHKNKSEENDSILQQNKEIGNIGVKTGRHNGSTIHFEDNLNWTDDQNRTEAVEIDKEKHSNENHLRTTMTNSGDSLQADNINEQNVGAIESTKSNKDKIKGTEYVSRENEEWMKTLNNSNPQITVNTSKQIIVDQPMDTID